MTMIITVLALYTHKFIWHTICVVAMLQRYHCRRQARARGLSLPQMDSLAPTVKYTCQESGELCEIFKFWSFPQSESKQCLQTASASGDFVP